MDRQKTWAERRAESARLIDEHKTQMAERYSLPRSHPKFERCYQLAWDHGHSSGFREVEGYFSEFVELVLE